MFPLTEMKKSRNFSLYRANYSTEYPEILYVDDVERAKHPSEYTVAYILILPHCYCVTGPGNCIQFTNQKRLFKLGQLVCR